MADLKARSRTRWRKRGYHVENGECSTPYATHDLFGFADLIAVPENPTHVAPAWIYIQSTSWGHVPTRLKKILTETAGRGQYERPIRELARMVLERGDKIVIEGWKKKSGRYVVREHWIELEDL